MKKIVLALVLSCAVLASAAAEEFRLGLSWATLNHQTTIIDTSVSGIALNFASSGGNPAGLDFFSDTTYQFLTSVKFGSTDVTDIYDALHFGLNLLMGINYPFNLGPVVVRPGVGINMDAYYLVSSNYLLSLYQEAYMDIVLGLGAQVLVEFPLGTNFALYGRLQGGWDFFSVLSAVGMDEYTTGDFESAASFSPAFGIAIKF